MVELEQWLRACSFQRALVTRPRFELGSGRRERPPRSGGCWNLRPPSINHRRSKRWSRAMSESIGIVIQARMGSTRLPGKVLCPILGEPLLGRLCRRLKGCSTIDTLIVATTDLARDQPVVDACRSLGVEVFRGFEDDVLARFVDAARAYRLETVVRITADNPLTDPQGIDILVEAYRRNSACLVHNAHLRGYPYGTGAELASMASLEACDRRPLAPDEREHLTTHIRRRPDEFPCVKVEAPPELFRPGYFLTVDYPEDLRLVELIYQHFGGRNDMRLHDIIAFLDANSELAKINAHLHQQFTD